MGFTVTNGQYEFRSPIGQGPRSTVHHGLDLRHGTPVILKTFASTRVTPAQLASYAAATEALRRAKLLGVLLPQEIFLTADPTPFAVFAVAPGESLESAMQRGALQWARAAELVARCAAILAAVARSTGQHHRSLKPSNVWLTPEGTPQILDFGVAELGMSGPIRRGAETVEYRAPEQLDGSPGDARSDVFTLATLLVELTTGIHPFAGATPFQAAHRLTQTPPNLAEFTRGMSSAGAREVAALATHALAGDPESRPPDAAAFAAKLDYVRPLVGTPAPARSVRSLGQPTPMQPTPPIDDPTTIQQLPNMRRLFASGPPVTAVPCPAGRSSALPEAAPAESESSKISAALPVPVAEDRVASRRSAPERKAERDIPLVDVNATCSFPRMSRLRPPANDELATVSVPLKRLAPRPSPAEATLILPETALEAAFQEHHDRTDVLPKTPLAVDSTNAEPAVRTRCEASPVDNLNDRTLLLPIMPDNHVRPSRFGAPPTDLGDRTLILPAEPDADVPPVTPVGAPPANEPKDRPLLRPTTPCTDLTGPTVPAASSVQPLIRLPSPTARVLLALNVACVVVLVVLLLTML